MKIRSTIPAVFFAASMMTASAELDMAAYKKAVASEKTTEVVAKFVAENPDKVVKLVQTSITETDASVEEIAAIVRAAIVAAPDKARTIYVAALAVAPDAHDAVMKVYYELVPSSGSAGSDSKGGMDNKGKGSEVGSEGQGLVPPNPLDFPIGVAGGTGPTPGGQGGFPLLPVGPSPTTIQPTIPPAPISTF